MRGYEADTDGMAGLARRLATGAADIEDVVAPPAAPDAGVLTALVAARLSAIAGAVATVSETVDAAGGQVSSSATSYANVDGHTASGFGRTT